MALALDVKDSNGAIRGFGKFLEHYCPNIVFRGYDAQTVTTELKTDADRIISEWLKDGLIVPFHLGLRLVGIYPRH